MGTLITPDDVLAPGGTVSLGEVLRNAQNMDNFSVYFKHRRFSDMDFTGYNLKYANFINCMFKNCTFTDVNFDESHFSYCSFYDVSMKNCSFYRASMNHCTIFGNYIDCDFTATEFYSCLFQAVFSCNTRGTEFPKCESVPYIPMACPSRGGFTGWKKAELRCYDNIGVLGTALVELYIPEDAKRSSAGSKKCRCDKAKVVNIWPTQFPLAKEPYDGKVFEARSLHDPHFVYKVGETVSVDDFDEDRWNECAPGIHFFVDPKDAYEY